MEGEKAIENCLFWIIIILRLGHILHQTTDNDVRDAHEFFANKKKITYITNIR